MQFLNTAHTEMKVTYYRYDASGNPMATYTRNIELNGPEAYFEDELELTENNIYGSSRIGVDNRVMPLVSARIVWPSYVEDVTLDNMAPYAWTTPDVETYDQTSREVGNKYYEMSNHLGNVLAVVTDRKLPNTSADVLYAEDFESGTVASGWETQTACGTPPSFTISGGKLVVVNACQTKLERFFEAEIGRQYTFTAEVTDRSTISGSGLVFQMFNHPVTGPATFTNQTITTSSVSMTFTATAELMRFSFFKTVVPAGNFTLDNILITTPGTGYVPDVVSFSDYSPYGTQLDQRHGQEGEKYRYGFQGQEMDDEVKGPGNSLNYEYRMHDPRIGRFFAVDPLAPKYPWYTPYQFSGNKVIHMVELEGLEEAPPGYAVENGGERPPEGTMYNSTDVGVFNAPNGQMLSGTDGEGWTAGSSNKLKSVAWVHAGDNNWLALAFETKSGSIYTWNQDKSWYANSKGEEFDDHFTFDITNMVGGSVTPVAQAFIDKVQKNNALYTFNKALQAHGGGLGSFLWDGFKQTISDIGEGGHKGTQALGSMYTSYLSGGGALTSQAPTLIWNGTTRGALKSTLGMRTLGGASKRLNYYTNIAYDIGLTGLAKRTKAPFLVQTSHNIGRVLAGKSPNTLFSTSVATIAGRSWQSSSIGMGLGLGAYGTITTFGGISFYKPQLTLGQQ